MGKTKYILIKSVVIFIAMASLVLIYLSFTSFNVLLNYTNGTFIVSLITIFFGGLAWVSNLGGFDGLGYSTYYVFVGNRAKTEDRKYKSYPDYMEKKKEMRKGKFYTIVPYFISGGILLLVSVILFLILQK